MPKKPSNPATDPLWGYPFPLRPHGKIIAATFEATVSRALSRALKELGRPRAEVAAEIAELLEEPHFSGAMLNNYTAESKVAHNINLKRFMAFVQATGATWLLDLLAEQVGCRVVQDRGMMLARLGAVEQQIEALSERKQQLAAALANLPEVMG